MDVFGINTQTKLAELLTGLNRTWIIGCRNWKEMFSAT